MGEPKTLSFLWQSGMLAQREDHYCPAASCAGLVLALAIAPLWMTRHDQMSDRLSSLQQNQQTC
jgi:hypothetical protein